MILDLEEAKDHRVHLGNVEWLENVVVLVILDQMVQMDQMVVEVPLVLAEVMVYLYVICCVLKV